MLYLFINAKNNILCSSQGWWVMWPWGFTPQTTGVLKEKVWVERWASSTPCRSIVFWAHTFFLALSRLFVSPMSFFYFLNLLTFINFWETQRDGAWMGEGKREEDTESKAGSRLWAVSTEPDAGLKLKNHEIMTWAEAGRLTDWATQVPQLCPSFRWMHGEVVSLSSPHTPPQNSWHL